MHILSLTFCFGFIALLIWRDCKRRPSVSYAIWVPTILMLILGSRHPSQWIQGGAVTVSEMGNEAGGSLLDALFFFVVIAVSFGIATGRGVIWNRIFTAN